MGNPLGLDGPPSVTSGIVSALDRTLEVEPGENLYGLIQTDAPITRGSSGGALLNGQGALIGVTTAIGVTDVGAEGLGFAVPVSSVLSIAEELIAEGVDRARLSGNPGADRVRSRRGRGRGAVGGPGRSTRAELGAGGRRRAGG